MEVYKIRKVNKKNINIFNKGHNLNKHSDSLSKSEKLMTGIGLWTSFYRSNPHRFVKDYLNINLKLFQKILIYMMMHYHYFMYIASRGQGKTYLTSIFCCCRAILFPETKIVLASGNVKQAIEVLTKIEDIRKNAPFLDREIENMSTNANNAICTFHNGSWIRVVASNEGARSARANLLLVDEFRMVDLGIINKVLRKFLTAPRHPKYLDKKEYEHLQERNKEIYLSSAWYQYHWSWDKFRAFFTNMVKGKKYFVCGLPYQLPMKERLLMREQVEDEMSEDDFDATAWSIEMECMFFGESEKAYFKFDDLQDNRVLPRCWYPKPFYDVIKDKSFKYIEKAQDEIRLLSCDIAGMSGKQNDASVYTIISLIPKKKSYERRVMYIESMVGGHAMTQSIRIRQLFDDFDCNYLVIDTMSFGLGIFDLLVTDLYDKERGLEYKAWTCLNDEKMAERCMSANPSPVIYSIKGNSALNSECAISLKDNLKRNKIRLLVHETEIKEMITGMKGWSNMCAEDQAKLMMPYIQTTALINEMVNLENEGKDNIVKLREPSNSRKDRYSSLSYGNYVANILERNLLVEEDSDYDFVFTYS